MAPVASSLGQVPAKIPILFHVLGLLARAPAAQPVRTVGPPSSAVGSVLRRLCSRLRPRASEKPSLPPPSPHATPETVGTAGSMVPGTLEPPERTYALLGTPSPVVGSAHRRALSHVGRVPGAERFCHLQPGHRPYSARSPPGQARPRND